MSGRIENGQLVTVALLVNDPEVGDAVLCKVKGRYMLHLIHARRGDQYLIGNNRGRINGWTPRKNIYGIVTSVEK